MVGLEVGLVVVVEECLVVGVEECHVVRVEECQGLERSQHLGSAASSFCQPDQQQLEFSL